MFYIIIALAHHRIDALKMLLYFTLSYLLSIPGALVYFLFVRKGSTPVRRRQFLYFVLAMSLSLPAAFLYFFSANSATQALQTLLEPSKMAAYQEEIELCYDKAIHEADFCQCEELAQTSIILYKKYDPYEAAIDYKSYLQTAYGAVALVIFIWLAFRCAFLVRLIRGSKKELKWIEGKAYYILYDDKNEILAASFRLWHRYIVWKPALNQLSEETQQAILYHEIAHIENRDTWQQFGIAFLQIFWFFNPVYYTIKKELHLLNEYLADAFAATKIGNERAYAALLIHLKEQQQFGLLQLFGTHPFKSRILELARPTTQKRRLSFPAFAVLVAMFWVGCSTTPVLTQQSRTFHEYELVHQEHLKTGKTYFCKTCLYKQAGEECE